MKLGTLLSAECVRQALAATLLRRVPASYPSVMLVRTSSHSDAGSTSGEVWTGMRSPAWLQHYMGVATRVHSADLSGDDLEPSDIDVQDVRSCTVVRVLSNGTSKED